MAERLVFHDWHYAFDKDFERTEKIPGLTRRQREWILREWRTVFNVSDKMNVCGFPVVKEEGFYLCGYNKQVQVHHIMPRGYATYVLGWDEKQINSPLNLIPLCETHHIAKGLKELDYKNNVVPAIHPDMEVARTRYKGKQHPTSYDFAFADRHKVMASGDIYWNDDWSRALLQKAEEVYYNYLNYLLEHGLKDPWPERKRK